MFSYNDPIFQAANNSPVKDTGFTELTTTSSTTSANSLNNNHNNNSNGPMYAYNDMLYSLEQHNVSTTSLGLHHHHHQQQQQSIASQQQQQQQQHQQQHHHHQQQMWHEQQQQQQQQQQHSNHYFTTDIQQEQSPYDHYNISPFSSPLINTNNTMIMGTTSQRSSIQSLPSAHPIPSTSTSVQQQQQQQQQQQLQLQQQQQQQQTSQRPRITTSLWDDEETVCYQVDVRGICVARRQDNDMVNGTKLLNVTGMSRGKRDGILKNEKGRVVVKVGAMHLKGVWVTFARAKALAIQFNIVDQLHPLFVDDPALYFYSNQLAHNYYIPNHPIYLQSQDSFQQQQQQQQNKRSSAYSMYSNNNSNSSLEFPVFHSSPSPSNYHNQPPPPQSQPQHQHQHHLHQQPQSQPQQQHAQQEYHHNLPAAPSVPSMIPVQQHQMSLYGYTTSTASSPSSLAHIPITTSATTTTITTTIPITTTTTTNNSAALATVDSIMNHY